MSEFDKEAEREKLRKQFAEDDQDRAETERMSELLLQGATMTNKHCEQCGSPLFRQNGNTFCPTCGGDGRTASAGPADSANSAESTETQPTSGATRTTDSEANRSPTPEAESARNPSVSTPTAGDSPADDQTPDRIPGNHPSAEGEADLAAAREGLVRTLTAFVRRAEAAESPSHARELLEAAREAAETLDAVDRVRGNR